MYLVICIIGLHIGLPFWKFYQHMCKAGEKKYNQYQK